MIPLVRTVLRAGRHCLKQLSGTVLGLVLVGTLIGARIIQAVIARLLEGRVP